MTPDELAIIVQKLRRLWDEKNILIPIALYVNTDTVVLGRPGAASEHTDFVEVDILLDQILGPDEDGLALSRLRAELSGLKAIDDRLQTDIATTERAISGNSRA